MCHKNTSTVDIADSICQQCHNHHFLWWETGIQYISCESINGGSVMWRVHHSSISIIRIITPILFVSIIVIVFSIKSVVPRISQANAAIHNHNFIGIWYNHGGKLTIQQDGHAHFVSRVYRWCIDEPPPCDTMDGNTITPGIQKDIVFNREQGNTLYGTIISSTDHTNDKTITATLVPNDMLNLNGETLCGSKAPPGHCGA
jgi:hypothetical protein